ncbi:MAG TPA: nucleoside phosphorylase [Ktedonobacteraceae bacterium]|nr:nucleoside phosphorylase [Ktedonobacteraceae bacterium]
MSHELSEQPTTPLLAQKHYDDPSIFTPENLLREARRQKALSEQPVPEICVLDPDGDLIDYLRATTQAKEHPTWACYHTTLCTWEQDGTLYGAIGRAVGAPFAVLVAEELFVSGCKLLVSITSAGQLLDLGQPPYMVLIDRALRDEGTSYHYLPPTPYSFLDPTLYDMLCSEWKQAHLPLHVGGSWTTDAPFRETEAMIAWGREQGLLAIEMEAAALYALASAKQYSIVCFAHVTNQMAQMEGDFEKGGANGSLTMVELIGQVGRLWLQKNTST